MTGKERILHYLGAWGAAETAAGLVVYAAIGARLAPFPGLAALAAVVVWYAAWLFDLQISGGSAMRRAAWHGATINGYGEPDVAGPPKLYLVWGPGFRRRLARRQAWLRDRRIAAGERDVLGIQDSAWQDAAKAGPPG